MDIRDVVNKDELIEQLAEMLLDFDTRLNKFNSDVYLYINKKTKKGRLEIFEYNGNSWIDDDHITIYTDEPHYEHMIDMYDHFLDGKECLANDLRISLEQLTKETLENLSIDNAEDLELSDYTDYVESNEKYRELIREAYRFYLKNKADYEELAENIWKQAEEYTKMRNEI